MTVDNDPRTGRYSLRAPCVNCPFRTDVPVFLRPGRAREIAESIRGGGEFPCHKTTVPDGDGGLHDHTGTSQVCAGSLAVMEREGQPNQMARIAERLGLYDPSRLAAAPVYDSLADWITAHQPVPTVVDTDGTVLQFEHCGVVDDGCVDPAGFGGSGGVYANPDVPTCNPITDSCEECGHMACERCRSDRWDDATGKLCVRCAEQPVWP